jgi:hypothetical protein
MGWACVEGDTQKRCRCLCLSLQKLCLSMTSEQHAVPPHCASRAPTRIWMHQNTHMCPFLQREWHRWDAKFTSDNDPVDIFDPDQLYVVRICDGGDNWACDHGCWCGLGVS